MGYDRQSRIARAFPKGRAMKLIVTIHQFSARRRPRVITTEIKEAFPLAAARKLWEVEQVLNALPTDLRWHFSLEESE